MIYLILCILISVVILTTFGLFDKFSIDRNHTIIISYFVSFLLAFLSINKEINLGELPDFQWFYLGLITGITFYIGFQLFALSTKKIGMAITSVAGNMSVVIPVFIAILFYHESTSILKIFGIILILLSFYLIFKKEKNIKIGRYFIFFPIMLFTFNGINASLLSYCNKNGADKNTMLFMAVIFASAFVFGAASNLLTKNKQMINYRSIIASIILGFLNFASTIIIMKSLTIYPDSIFFPIYNSGYIIISAIVGIILFKEKLRLINWIGVGIALIAIIVITSNN